MLVHKHLIVKAVVAKPIVDPDIATDWMRRLVDRIGMKITEHGGPHCDYVDKEGNHGIACVAVIETSHVALHVWDRCDPPLAQLDVYSCAEFNESDVLDLLGEMEIQNVTWIILDRAGDLEPVSKFSASLGG